MTLLQVLHLLHGVKRSPVKLPDHCSVTPAPGISPQAPLSTHVHFCRFVREGTTLNRVFQRFKSQCIHVMIAIASRNEPPLTARLEGQREEEDHSGRRDPSVSSKTSSKKRRQPPPQPTGPVVFNHLPSVDDRVTGEHTGMSVRSTISVSLLNSGCCVCGTTCYICQI